jgi:hypothetical protein
MPEKIMLQKQAKSDIAIPTYNHSALVGLAAFLPHAVLPRSKERANAGL